MPSIRCANPACPRQGDPFYAKSRRALYCSDACKKAASRGRGTCIASPTKTLDAIMAGMDILPEPPARPLRWEEVNSAHHKLTDGKPDPKDDGPMAFPTTRTLAAAVDPGITERASWLAVCGSRTIGPAWMEMAGLSDDRPGLAEAKLVAEAMATLDVRPLVLKAHRPDDCTEDMRLALKGMLELLLEPDDTEEPTELPDFNTEEAMVARLNRDWCVVEADGFWILQHRVGDGDEWEWAARCNRRRTLLHAVESLVDEPDAEAMAVLNALPEIPGVPG
mgnify:CR=1 FL=1